MEAAIVPGRRGNPSWSSWAWRQPCPWHSVPEVIAHHWRLGVLYPPADSTQTRVFKSNMQSSTRRATGGRKNPRAVAGYRSGWKISLPLVCENEARCLMASQWISLPIGVFYHGFPVVSSSHWCVRERPAVSWPPSGRLCRALPLACDIISQYL